MTVSPASPNVADLETSRQRVNALRTRLADFFVNKADVIDLMTVCMVAQEPLLTGVPNRCAWSCCSAPPTKFPNSPNWAHCATALR
jgi:hypothetical protein